MESSPHGTVVQVGGDGLAWDVVDGLTRQPKRLASKYLYDTLGSRLFEAICDLPWYNITRGERALIGSTRDRLVGCLDEPATLIELGGGSGEKLSLLVEALNRQHRSVCVHLIDISPTALDLAGRTLARYPSVSYVPHQAPYSEGLRAAVTGLQRNTPAMVLFLGSNIGNLGPADSDRFLRDIQMRLRAGDWFLVGADLIKPEPELVLAYDDPLGVTAAFNKNLLARLNRELSADFDLEQFEYRVVWNPSDSRVESYLVSRTKQTVCLTAARFSVCFDEGEVIWTESSYKYKREELVAMGEAAGFVRCEQWVEPKSRFALTLFQKP